ncbi:Peptidase aspartic catalytic [Penicillium riverlandense]|uniref:Peptidase aspartic catalytic n=1 Tax=Penicillium riverlandense TaxID=1903569 RepID=UPI00254877CB|nr:Peptidase aspartic catalytic [Penicillium riverlandense]KAJ5819445.1 Peptidase aspartic catalytic [Penicillium riverlandense]
MVVFSKATSALTLAIAASAMPIDSCRTSKSKTFSVNQVARKHFGPRKVSLAGMYAHALGKHGAEIPDKILAAVENGSVIATPSASDEKYDCPVTIGNTIMNLDFDTGSSDLWVFSTKLPASEQTGHSIYDPSSATPLSGYTWNISYSDGSSASGNVFQDTVTVGGVQATSQAVEAAEQVSQRFVSDRNNDGLLGLAFSSINTVTPQQQLTFFDTVKSQLAQPLFAACLKHNQPGVYDFGFIDQTKFTGSLAYTPWRSWIFYLRDCWQVTHTPSSIGLLTLICKLDTGTTLLLLDTSVVSAYYQQVTGAKNDPQVGGYTFPCSAQLPDFSISVGSYQAVVSGSLINYAPVSSGSTTCFGGIQGNSGIGFSIFGDIFLKSQYVVFDSIGPQIGFAQQT